MTGHGSVARSTVPRSDAVGARTLRCAQGDRAPTSARAGSPRGGGRGRTMPRRRRAWLVKLTVHNPMGYPPKVVGRALAPRLESLDGKTVYLVDARFDDSDIFLKQMQSWFADNMPNVKTKFVQ